MYWTNYAEDKILRTFNGATLQAPSVMYVALYLSNPGETGSGTEIIYTGYERKPITFSAPAEQANATATSNVEDVSFATSNIGAGTVTHCALFDSVTGGNMWAYMALDEPVVVSAGVAPLIQAEQWHFSTSGNFSRSFKASAINVLRGVSIPGFSPYIALYNGNPDNGGSELSGGNYERFPVTFGVPEVQAAGQSMITSSEASSSPRANTLWGTWTHTAICNAASGGAVMAFAQRDTDLIMGAGKAALVNPGELSISLN